jgi:phosphoribosylformimino-5-aminoimidazole carboxamide ribotide isomerase
MDLYPAIDLMDGAAVRLRQGDFDRRQGYGDPRELAHSWDEAGINWLHVVDLDAARRGEPVHRDLIRELARDLRCQVQTGGGIRTEADVDGLLEAGVDRVILGTVALEDPALTRRVAERYPGRVALGLDYRQDPSGRQEVAVRGWEQGAGRSVQDVLAEMADLPLAALVVTAIARDGMLQGPDIEGLEGVLATTAIPLIASGGVSSVADLEGLARLSVATPPLTTAGPDPGEVEPGLRRGLAGAITGRALVDGRFSVEEGMAACKASA